MSVLENRRRIEVLFSGHVQGVGFRYRTASVAKQFAVTGFVRNLDDGRVQLIAEGRAGELDRFVAEIGAAMADFIHNQQVVRSEATQEFLDFAIRH